MKILNDLYYLRELNTEEIYTLFDRLKLRWDISREYWFPLYDASAESVVAFDSIDFENYFGYEKLRDLLRDRKEIFEIREDKYKGYIVKYETFSPAYEAVGEGYWFDSTMDWIIYCSHEGSITFGGEWLINRLKLNWKEWEKYLFE